MFEFVRLNKKSTVLEDTDGCICNYTAVRWKINGKVSSLIAHMPILRVALFFGTPYRLLWESFSHAAINAQKHFVDKYPPLCIAGY